MRIIAGEFKGRSVKAVPGHFTRPIGDKSKEALFQMIGPFFDGGSCLDLFAGSGALGIEAISRGMNDAVFIDKHPKAIRTIHENINLVRIDQQTKVFRMDAFRALKVVSKNNSYFDLILIDPPYQKVDYHKILNDIMNLNLLNKGGFIVCEHDPSLELSDLASDVKVYKQVTYSATTAITIFQKSY